MLTQLSDLGYSNDRRNARVRDQTLESLPDCVKLLDLEGNVLFINGNGRQRLGIADFNHMRGRPWTALWPSESHAKVREAVGAAGEGRSAQFEAFAPTATGEPKWWDVTVTPIRDGHSRIEKLLAISRDVSALHQAREHARAITARLQFGLDAAEIGHWDLDLLNDTSRRSLQHDRCFGYPDALPSWGFQDTLRHVHPDDRVAVTEQFGAAVSGLQNWSTEFRVIWPDTTVHWLIVHGAIYYVDGRPVRMGGIVYETTRRKQIEIDLRQSRQEAVDAADRAELERSRLNALLEAAPVGIAYADAQGALVLVNSENIRLWGNHPLPAKTAEYAGWKGWWADGSARHGQRIAPDEWGMARALRGEAATGDVIEIEPFDAPGVRRTVLLRGAPVHNKEGHITGAVIAQIDITNRVLAEAALRESEAKFKTIANAMPQMVWSTLADGRHDYFNQQWYTFTGLPEDASDDGGWQRAFHPDDLQRAGDAWQACLASGETYEIQYRLRHRTAQYRWVLGRALPITAADGKIIRWMGTCTDIHDQKLAEEALKEKNRKKDEFLAMLGHEIRNPLSAIATAATMIGRESGVNDRLARSLAILDRQTGNLSKIVDDLLDAARVTAGKVKLRLEVLDFAEVARSCVEQMQATRRIADWHISVTTETAWVYGDRTRLEQVINNLLTNAMKYTPRGGEISVSVACDGDDAVFEIRDTGIGIPACLLPTIFELFVQAPSTLDRTQGGLGIGLTLVNQLTSLHNGTVAAQSAGANQGSAFIVRLPRAAAPGKLPQRKVRHEPARSRKVLLIEDNTDSREMIAMALSTHGHDVLEAGNGRDGIRLLTAENPTVAVIDIGLPDMNGFEIAKQLRADPAFDSVQLIALTGYGQESDRQRALDAGFDEHLVKPVEIGVLLRCVEDAK